MTYFAYLDEFGHIGPYVSRQDLRHNDSPVFGLAGFVHNPNRLYQAILREAIKRIDEFCESDCHPPEDFALILDEHDQRSRLITEAARSMYAREEPRRHLIEPPFHLESHRYQTLQAADWIAGLVGRLAATWADPDAYPENEVFRRYFEHRFKTVSRRSGVRT